MTSPITIDLTSSYEATTPAVASARVSLSPLLATQDDEELSNILLGTLSCRIVGIRYYNGVAHPGEYVKLKREPNNPYDRNAIRVDNTHGEKVGHIKATVAKALAPIMDKFPDIHIDGSIPHEGDRWSLPCQIDFFGSDYDDMMKVEQLLSKYHQYWSKNPNLTASSSSSKNDAIETPAATKPTVTQQKLDWRSAQQQLDDMFEKVSKEQLENLPNITMPDTLTVTLQEHQIEGVKWLYKRETYTDSIPFYKQITENRKKVWFSEITNSSQSNPPQPIKGAILADDMGLGKTVQAIALMLANPGNKTPGTPKTNLIICPVSVMPNWMQQIEQHVAPDTLKVGLYHGSDRFDLLDHLDDYDVLIASYGTLSADYGAENTENTDDTEKHKKKKRRTGTSVFTKTFHRIILDEAHTIRNTKSRTFKCCEKLQATYRLALTGTPLQNKPEDIHSLFAFLKVEPLGDRDIFRRSISQPIQNGDDIGLARLRTMMAHIALRRNKTKLDLVEKTVELRSIGFPPDSPHKRIYDTLFRSAQLLFKATLSEGDDKALKNYMMILETLTRIRQCCASGSLVPKERVLAAERVLSEIEGKSMLTAEEGLSLLKKLKGAFQDADTVECAICYNEMDEKEAVILRSCKHVFCEPCLSQVEKNCHGLCPMCRQKFGPADMIKESTAIAASSSQASKSVIESTEGLDLSPKIHALGMAIREMKEDEKGVIFSQFTKFLDIIEPFLEAEGYSFCRIDGSKTAKQRINAIKAFQSTDGGPRFILCSLHAAGTGITLHRANHAFMLDTWFNFAIEQQAMDRVHRIGQTRPVRIIRFIMKDSIEEAMIKLQEKKAALSKGALQKLNPDEARKVRLGDLKSLFSLN